MVVHSNGYQDFKIQVRLFLFMDFNRRWMELSKEISHAYNFVYEGYIDLILPNVMSKNITFRQLYIQYLFRSYQLYIFSSPYIYRFYKLIGGEYNVQHFDYPPICTCHMVLTLISYGRLPSNLEILKRLVVESINLSNAITLVGLRNKYLGTFAFYSPLNKSKLLAPSLAYKMKPSSEISSTERYLAPLFR